MQISLNRVHFMMLALFHSRFILSSHAMPCHVSPCPYPYLYLALWQARVSRVLTEAAIKQLHTSQTQEEDKQTS